MLSGTERTGGTAGAHGVLLELHLELLEFGLVDEGRDILRGLHGLLEVREHAAATLSRRAVRHRVLVGRAAQRSPEQHRRSLLLRERDFGGSSTLDLAFAALKASSFAPGM